MKIFHQFPTVNISKLNVWYVICIAKHFIWTTLKAIISIFRSPPPPSDSRFSKNCISAKYDLISHISDPNKPYINGKLICSAFIWSIHLNFEKLTLMTGFVVQGHIFIYYSIRTMFHVSQKMSHGSQIISWYFPWYLSKILGTTLQCPKKPV